MSLADKECVPCHGGVPPLGEAEVTRLLGELQPGWEAIEGGRRLWREWRFPDFKSALSQANRIGELADAQDHHPDLHIAWGRLVVEIWTHTIGGLSEADFVFAAKVDRLLG
jgi:4a-hydroxytetrahydrobiopterin dehydratase